MKKLIIIPVAIAALLVLAFVAMNILKQRGMPGFFSGIQWNSPYSIKMENPFEGLKFNPFRK